MAGKYRLLYEAIIKKIEDGYYGAGSKLPSEAELMEQYSVSRQTVRSTLALLREDGLVTSYQGRGTFITQKSTQNRTGRIALIIFRTNSSAFPTIIETTERVLSENGYIVMLSVSNQSVHKEKLILERLLLDPVDGVIFYPLESQYPCLHIDLIRKLERCGTRFLFVERNYQDSELSSIPFVSIDNYEASYRVTHRLIEEGFTKIGCIGLMREQILRRYCGIRQALYDNDLAVHCIFDMSTGVGTAVKSMSEDLNPSFPKDISDRLIQDGIQECDALLCLNDILAAAVNELLLRKGTGEIRTIVIYGNCEVTAIPGIRYIRMRHNVEQLAKLAAKKMVSMIQGNGEQSETIPFTIE